MSWERWSGNVGNSLHADPMAAVAHSRHPLFYSAHRVALGMVVEEALAQNGNCPCHTSRKARSGQVPYSHYGEARAANTVPFPLQDSGYALRSSHHRIPKMTWTARKESGLPQTPHDFHDFHDFHDLHGGECCHANAQNNHQLYPVHRAPYLIASSANPHPPRNCVPENPHGTGPWS